MKHVLNPDVMAIKELQSPANSNVLGKLQSCTKFVHFESFGYHGELLVVFGSSYFVFECQIDVPYLR